MNSVKKVNILITSFLLILLTSCSYQKRLYRNGFYVEKKHPTYSTNQKTVKTTLIYQQNIPIKIRQPENIQQKTSDNKILADASHKTSLITTKYYKKSLQEDSICDKMLLKSGDDYLVKVLEITDTEIKYKKCNTLNGSIYIINKSKVYLIQYANGTTEHIISNSSNSIEKNKASSAHHNNTNKKVRKHHRFYFAAVLWTLSSFSTSIIGLIFGMFSARRAIWEIKQNPDLYKGIVEMYIIMYLCLGLLTIFAIGLIGIGILYFSAVLGFFFIVIGLSIVLIIIRFLRILNIDAHE